MADLEAHSPLDLLTSLFMFADNAERDFFKHVTANKTTECASCQRAADLFERIVEMIVSALVAYTKTKSGAVLLQNIKTDEKIGLN